MKKVICTNMLCSRYFVWHNYRWKISVTKTSRHGFGCLDSLAVPSLSVVVCYCFIREQQLRMNLWTRAVLAINFWQQCYSNFKTGIANKHKPKKKKKWAQYNIYRIQIICRYKYKCRWCGQKQLSQSSIGLELK